MWLKSLTEETRSREPGESRWMAHLESYPEEVLLRVRHASHTVLLVRLAPDDVTLARSSTDGLRAVAIGHLKLAEEFAVEDF